MKEKDRVLISDMEVLVFKALLTFVYTDSLPDMGGEGEKTVMAQHLLVAADRYDLKRLKLICEDRLCGHIDRSTVTTTLVLAEQYDLAKLHMPAPPSVSAAGGSTSSTVSARKETGWHVLKVEGYSQIKGVVGVGKRIKSGTFHVGGYTWCIGCFPAGFSDETADWICVDACLENPPATGDIMVRLKSSLLDRVGEPVSAYTQIGSITAFSSAHKLKGYINFIQRTVLESSYLYDDSFKIRCDITVFMEVCIRTATNTEASLVVPPPDMHCHFGAILESRLGTDVTFMVSGEQFTAHRIVLAARSPVFMAELFGPMKEKDATVVQIDDMEARVFRALLHFIYTDSLPQIDDEDKVVMAQHLLVAADKYNMERLKWICADILSKYIDTSLVATTLVLAEQHGCHGLKETCFEFLKAPGNLTAAMAGDGFRHVTSSCPSLLEELLAKVAPYFDRERIIRTI
ncbi:hypothetical protein PR202_gb13418 [Eleusine coracana subsp. coracana]|uniref:Uncharacterized protein n=1 Tax=Eleusine coracana subsp. coracana TaxID=191504 RepID=A0AAV5EQD2_ELECO|nr:hypothetical protein PR202_gb13418 [Eleusine coracana subsp. coracana]